MLPAPEAPPPPCPPADTEEWAAWQLRHTFTPDDARAITDLVGVCMVPYPSLWRGRVPYARVCHERRWQGWYARLAWECMEALLKDDMDDDIPF